MSAFKRISFFLLSMLVSVNFISAECGTAQTISTVDPNNFGYNSAVAVDPVGDAVVVYLYDDVTNSLREARSSSYINGIWQTSQAIVSVPLIFNFVYNAIDVGVDASGKAITVFASQDFTLQTSEIFASTLTKGGSWTAPVSLDSASAAPGPNRRELSNPHIAVDPSGNAVAIWNSFDFNTFFWDS